MDRHEKAGEMELSRVYKSYKDKQALAEVSFKVERGVFTCLCGPSGCGKSTLINLMAGYEFPDLGEITMDGETVKEAASDKLVVFQETALFPWMTVWDNTMFGPRARGEENHGAVEQKARDLIKKVALTGFEDKYPSQLSGGMQRRAELIRALINEPKIMLLDEPFRGLDAMTREIMQEYIIRLYEETKITILFITAELEEAIYLGDVVYFLTSAPATVKEKMVVDLPRPRLFKHTITDRFLELQSKAIRIVDEEAVKAFGGRR